MVRWYWVNFQYRGVLFICIIVGQGPIALTVGAGGGCLDIFSLVYHFSFLSPSLWETARYRLKYCLKGPLSPKTTNQPKSNICRILEQDPTTHNGNPLVYRFLPYKETTTVTSCFLLSATNPFKQCLLLKTRY